MTDRRTLLALLFALAALAAPPPARAEAERISLDLKDADLIDVLRYFADVSGTNVILDPGVRGRVTLRLIDVPWDAALEVVLKTNGLWYQLDGNVLFIAPVEVLTRRAAEEAALAEQKALAEPLRTVVVRVSYADAAHIAQVLEKTALSPRGSVVVDARTQSLIVTDIASRLPRARATARSLDR